MKLSAIKVLWWSWRRKMVSEQGEIFPNFHVTISYRTASDTVSSESWQVLDVYNESAKSSTISNPWCVIQSRKPNTWRRVVLRCLDEWPYGTNIVFALGNANEIAFEWKKLAFVEFYYIFDDFIMFMDFKDFTMIMDFKDFAMLVDFDDFTTIMDFNNFMLAFLMIKNKAWWFYYISV